MMQIKGMLSTLKRAGVLRFWEANATVDCFILGCILCGWCVNFTSNGAEPK